MKRILMTILILSFAITSCKKENHSTPTQQSNSTLPYGPVRYYLTPFDKSLFNSYSNFHTLLFVDSATNDTTHISYYPNTQAWDIITGPTQVQGDTVSYGESAIIFYAHGTTDIGALRYMFSAYQNGIDTLRIDLAAKGSHLFWALNMQDTNLINNLGFTPFVRLDSITLLSHIFYDVYILQHGNSLSSPGDSSNNCYFTKVNGIIAFTDKRFNRFWIRTNY